MAFKGVRLRRKLLLGISSLLLAGMCLFPPWNALIVGSTVTLPDGYHFLFRQRLHESSGGIRVVSVDFGQLALQMTVVVFMGLGVVLIFGRNDWNRTTRTTGRSSE